MLKKAYEGKYAIGAFNVNNMEESRDYRGGCEVRAPLIFRSLSQKYAKHAI